MSWSTRYSACSLAAVLTFTFIPLSAPQISETRWRGKETKLQKKKWWRFWRQRCVLRLIQLLPVCQAEQRSSSSRPLQGVETAAVRAASEICSLTCFCFYSQQQALKNHYNVTFRRKIYTEYIWRMFREIQMYEVCLIDYNRLLLDHFDARCIQRSFMNYFTNSLCIYTQCCTFLHTKHC